ncbi:MAG: deoxyribodipyrimidine photolyase, partial [Alphaproteobacteria bacterium]|nr:deoxyribodipyrimidine photolyase [Alphaproteobacteria bacterium]
MKKPLSIVWFKKDLRIHDHRPLARAAAQGPCLPLYIVEPELWSQPDQSPRQWLFAQECLTSLNIDLSQLGQPLCVFTGDALSIFQSLHQRHGIASLWSHQETGNHWTYDRDRRIKTWAQAHSIAWYEEQAGGVIRRLISRDHWAQSWDRTMAETPTPPPHRLEPLEEEWSFDVPSAEELFTSSDVCENRQAGGRVEALKLLKTFLYDRGQNYRFHMSSPLTARDACSRL